MQKIRTFFKYLMYSFAYKNREISPYSNIKSDVRKIINTSNRLNVNFEKFIWMYWEGSVVPYIVQKCVQRVKKLHPDFKVVFLNAEDIKDYLPDFSIANKSMPIANKSDLIRLELLYRYGGVWLDSTIILNESLHWMVNLMQERKLDCIGYVKDSNVVDYDFPVIESWLLCCPPQNVFIKLWLDELRPLSSLGAKEYFKLISSREDYLEIKQNIDRPEYLLVYLSQQIAMRKNNDFNILYQIAEETAFYYQEKLNWNFKKINFEFMLKGSSILPPVIKLISHNFSDIDYCKVNGFINEKSIIGRLFNNE